MMIVNDDGIALIKTFEGWRAKAYRDPVGIWTIGYGHTSMAGRPVVERGLVITPEQGDEILRRDVTSFARGVAKLVTVKLNSNQFSALVSFAYNVGLGGFKRSAVLKAVNDGDFDAVPRRLNLWTKAGGKVLPGLVRRRAAEGALFLRKDSKVTMPAAMKPIVAPAEQLEDEVIAVPASPRGDGAGAAAGGAVVVGTGAAAAWGVDPVAAFLMGGCALLAIFIIVLVLKARKQP